MEVVKAQKRDLPQLKKVFDRIVDNMHKNGINLWNEHYPYEEFEFDIDDGNLYLIKDNQTIVAAFGLYDNISGKECFKWSCSDDKAKYIGRIGVNVDIGTKVIDYAKSFSKQEGKQCLRLTVVDFNQPAINLYIKKGFVKVDGVYKEIIESENIVLRELGFEILVD